MFSVYDYVFSSLMPSAQVFGLYPSDLLEFPCESLPGELPAA